MKIISKFKDYYDFLQGIYGVDEKVVYERKTGINNLSFGMTLNSLSVYWRRQKCFIETSVLSICDEFYFAIKHNDKIITDKQEIVDFLNENNFDFYDTARLDVKKIKVENLKELFIWKSKYDKLNSHFGTPVIGLDCFNHYRNNETNPNLQQEYDWIKSILPPKEIYLKISNFLSKKDINLVNKPEDMLRFESKGFDKKSSFRK